MRADRIDVQFRHMDRSETLEDYVLEKVGHAIERFAHRHDAHVLVWLISDLNRANRGTPEFCCEIEVRYPPKRDIFVQKGSIDMYTAVQMATDALETLLDESGKREKDQRHEPKPAFVQP